jgi:hypothetical protein
MRLFPSDDIIAFLKALDCQLDGPFEVEIIGGAAGILYYDLKTHTEDIDTTTSVGDIEGAIEETRKKSGLPVPMGVAGVWDGPYEYRSRRLQVHISGTKNLWIYVPEKHDWALMKIMRLKDKDRDHILKVARTAGFDSAVFLPRFLEEMTHVIGRKQDVVFNFIVMMGELFSKKEAERMASEIKAHKYWRDLF